MGQQRATYAIWCSYVILQLHLALKNEFRNNKYTKQFYLLQEKVEAYNFLRI